MVGSTNKLKQRKSKGEATRKICKVKAKESLDIILSNTPKDQIDCLHPLITNLVS